MRDPAAGFVPGLVLTPPPHWYTCTFPCSDVVLPPQSTYWYISWETCSVWPKYEVVTVTLEAESRAVRAKL